MRSLDVLKFGGTIENRKLERPAINGQEILIKVLFCGVCHSDCHTQSGFLDLGDGEKLTLSDRGMNLPLTLGHEIYGEIVAAGPEADAKSIGSRGVVFPWIGCGTCRNCVNGIEHLCLKPRYKGSWQPGGFAEYIVLPSTDYLFDAGDLDPASAATLPCSGLTSFSALKKLGRLLPDDWIFLIGMGGVGLAAVSFARALGISNIVVFDLSPDSRAAALDLGAQVALDPRDLAAIEDFRASFGDAVFGGVDFVGNPHTFELGTSLPRRGGKYVAVGLFGGNVKLKLPLIPTRPLQIIGSYLGSLEEMDQMMSLVRNQPIAPIPRRCCTPKDINRVMNDIEEGNVTGRIVLEHTHGES